MKAIVRYHHWWIAIGCIAVCLTTQFVASAVAQHPKSEPTLLLKLECVKTSIPSGTAPLLRFAIENVGKADEKILKPRGDLQDTYYDLVITKDGKEVLLPRAISDPGPFSNADYLTLQAGKKALFTFSRYAVAVQYLAPGKYEARVRFWQDPRSHTTPVMSPVAIFTVVK
jgi:hypothetical protein